MDFYFTNTLLLEFVQGFNTPPHIYIYGDGDLTAKSLLTVAMTVASIDMTVDSCQHSVKFKLLQLKFRVATRQN